MKRFVLAGALMAGVSALFAQEASVPRLVATVKTLVDTRDSSGFVPLLLAPKGRVLLGTTKSQEVRAYNLATRSMSVVLNFPIADPILSMPAAGDQLLFLRAAEGTRQYYVWSVPVNPQTALPTGDPKRVSVSRATMAVISPDGRSVVAAVPVSTDKPGVWTDKKLVVIPVTGGTERVLWEGNFRRPMNWSPDGKWIYFAKNTGDTAAPVVQARIASSGGTPEVLTPAMRSGFPGLSPDGKRVVLFSGTDSLGVRYSIFDTEKHTLSSFALLGASDASGVWLNNGLHMLGARYGSSGVLHTVPAGGGVDQVIALKGAEQPEYATMSLDGRKLAAVVRVDGEAMGRLLVMNADGSDQRPRGTARIGFDGVHVRQSWSPDGKYLAYLSTWQSLSVLEVATGRAIPIGKSTRFGSWFWKSDSRSILWVQMNWDGTREHASVHESTLDGRDRVLRDITGMGQQGAGLWINSDTSAVAGYWGLYVSLVDSSTRQLFPPAYWTSAATAATFPVMSLDGRLYAQLKQRNGVRTVEMRTMTGELRSTVALPFAVAEEKILVIHPDNRSIFVATPPGPTTPAAIYRVPMDGTAPKAVATLKANERVKEFSISPGGKTLLYVSWDDKAVQLLDIDLGVGLKSTAARKE